MSSAAALSVETTISAIVEAASRDLNDADLAGVVLATIARKRLLFGKLRVKSGIAASGRVTTHLSPQRKSAPHVPSARRMDDRRSGRSPGSRVSTLLRPSRALLSASPVAFKRRIRRRQLRGQLRTSLAVGTARF